MRGSLVDRPFLGSRQTGEVSMFCDGASRTLHFCFDKERISQGETRALRVLACCLCIHRLPEINGVYPRDFVTGLGRRPAVFSAMHEGAWRDKRELTLLVVQNPLLVPSGFRPIFVNPIALQIPDLLYLSQLT